MPMTYAPSKGFTLIELLVSLSIFVIIMLAATSAYLAFISSNRQAQTTSTVVNSISFSIDNMAREIRTGRGYTYSYATGFKFTNADNCDVTYSRQTSDTVCGTVPLGGTPSCIVRAVGGSCAASSGAVTDSSIKIASLQFYPRGTNAGSSDGQPMVTIVVGGEACIPNADCTTDGGKVKFQIETAATQRLPDL